MSWHLFQVIFPSHKAGKLKPTGPKVNYKRKKLKQISKNFYSKILSKQSGRNQKSRCVWYFSA